MWLLWLVGAYLLLVCVSSVALFVNTRWHRLHPKESLQLAHMHEKQDRLEGR
jgi:hypothetical protein